MCDITQPQMSPVNCWPWSHNWTKWKDIEQGSVIHIKSQVRTGKYIIQERICVGCDKKQLRREIAAVGYSE